MSHHAGLLSGERSTMADTIQRYSSSLLSRCSLLCLEDEVALRVCISFDPWDSHVMQLCSAVTADSGNADDAKHLGGWFIWEVCVSMCMWGSNRACIYACVCGRVRKRNGGIISFVCLQASCLSRFLKRDEMMQYWVWFPFHSLHASASGRGVHHVCIRLKSVWSSAHWKVCIHLDILSLVCVQVIEELLVWVAHIQTKGMCAKVSHEHRSN